MRSWLVLVGVAIGLAAMGCSEDEAPAFPPASFDASTQPPEQDAATPTPAADAGPEYTRELHETRPNNAFFVEEVRCDVGDTLLEGTCLNEGAPYSEASASPETHGQGWRCGNYGAVDISIRCTR